jgi:hypothetical protein
MRVVFVPLAMLSTPVLGSLLSTMGGCSWRCPWFEWTFGVHDGLELVPHSQPLTSGPIHSQE